MLIGLVIVLRSAHGSLVIDGMDHLRLAIPYFIFTIFTQAFIMFYFIGVSKFTLNIWNILNSREKLEDLFDDPPSDLSPYMGKTKKFVLVIYIPI